MIAWAAPAIALAAFFAILVAFTRLPPRPALGLLLIAIAAAFAFFRVFAIAIPLGLLAISFLRQGIHNGATPSPGKTSKVRTDALSMRLDHDTGEIDGDVISGPFEGRQLSEMNASDLQDLLAWLEAEQDENSVSLVLAFLDRHGDTSEEEGPTHATDAGAMSAAEAYRILGLEPDASTEDVRAAHKRLIRKVHPDLGGSSALASMINAAKEKLDPS
ncbi:MAG: DnaJ domain-containing protein [Pseudomonadota bacterium]